VDSWDLHRTDLYSCPHLCFGGFAKPIDFKPPITITIKVCTKALSTQNGYDERQTEGEPKRARIIG